MTEAQAKGVVVCETEAPNGFAQTIRVGRHEFRADVGASLGSDDSAPDAHDYFDASLAACKALTATWYARRKGIALERVTVETQRNDSDERAGKYVLKVKVGFHGNLSDEDKKRLYDAIARCPVHRLMTTTEVVIETAPLAD